MIASFLTWWLACLSALLSRIGGAFPRFAARVVVIEVTPHNESIAFLRHRGRKEPLGLGAAARLANRLPVVLCPRATDVLVRTHTVPAASRRDVQSILSYELPRITPFAPEELLWRWDAERHPHDSGHLMVTLTMIPRIALAPVAAALDRAGVVPDLVELDRRPAPLRIPMRPAVPARRSGLIVLGAVCVALAFAAVVMPVVLQSLALDRTEEAIAASQPAVRQVEALRKHQAAYREGQMLLADESRRVGDTLSILAAVSRALPDDCYLTNLALLGRQLTLSGRSASAAHLITVLAADPGIRDPAFAAPVLRGGGPAGDVFMIKASAAP